MKKTAIAALLCLTLLGPAPAAFAQELAVGGQIVGIQIRTRGVLVAGVGPVETAEGRWLRSARWIPRRAAAPRRRRPG